MSCADLPHRLPDTGCRSAHLPTQGVEMAHKARGKNARAANDDGDAAILMKAKPREWWYAEDTTPRQQPGQILAGDPATMRFREKKHRHQDEGDTFGEYMPPEVVGLRDRIAHFTW